MKFKKIIGLDTSTNLTGIGIITYDSEHKMSVKSTSINLKNQGPFSDAKFKNMVMAIYDVIKNEKPDVIVIEDNCVEGSNANMNPFYARKLKNLIGSCMAIGYIKNTEVILYSPTQWRSIVRDKTKDWDAHRAYCKAWAINQVKEIFNITATNDDEAEAILIAYAYIKENKNNDN